MKVSGALLVAVAVGIGGVNGEGEGDGEGDCPDIRGRVVSPGLHYVPGPDTCTLCICDAGRPKWCKAVLCSPPRDCRSLFRQGDACCEFVCLDDALSARPDPAPDARRELGLRLTATAAAALLLLSAAVAAALRLRRRKADGRRTGGPASARPQDGERQPYLGQGLAYVCDDAPPHFPSLWKPPGGYFPRGEAPPPYEEAVAQARAERRADPSEPFKGFPFAPGRRRALPPEATVSRGDDRAAAFSVRHFTGEDEFIGALKFVGAFPTSADGNGAQRDERERVDRSRCSFPYGGPDPQSPAVESFINAGPFGRPRIIPDDSLEISRHRTIPRTFGVSDGRMGETRNYVHFKRHHSGIPKNFINADVLSYREDASGHSGSNVLRFCADANNPRLISIENPEIPTGLGCENNYRYPKDNNLRLIVDNVPKARHKNTAEFVSNQLEKIDKEKTVNRPESVPGSVERQSILSLPTDTTPCSCSYAEDIGTINDDQDDYHSECENCKSANSSRYYLDESEEGSEHCETMTLHRKPNSEHGAEDLNQLPTSLTLPVKTKRNRCPPGSRDAWFSSMPGTSSSEDD